MTTKEILKLLAGTEIEGPQKPETRWHLSRIDVNVVLVQSLETLPRFRRRSIKVLQTSQLRTEENHRFYQHLLLQFPQIRIRIP